MSSGSSSDFSGMVKIVALLVMSSAVISVVTGTWLHWIATGAGIAIGLLAASSINRQS